VIKARNQTKTRKARNLINLKVVVVIVIEIFNCFVTKFVTESEIEPEITTVPLGLRVDGRGTGAQVGVVVEEGETGREVEAVVLVVEAVVEVQVEIEIEVEAVAEVEAERGEVEVESGEAKVRVQENIVQLTAKVEARNEAEVKIPILGVVRENLDCYLLSKLLSFLLYLRICD